MAIFDIGKALRAQAEGKAIPAHPALMDSSTPTSVYSPGASRQDAKLSQREAPRHSQAYGGDQAIDWVYDSIGLYQDATSTAPYKLVKEDGTPLVERKTSGTPPDHNTGPADLYRLLKKPNPFMLYDELVELLVIDLLLVGNAYWFKFRMTSDGKPLALYRLAPSHVKVIPGAFGPKRYEYQPPGAKDPLKIDPEQVIHFKRPNPHSAYYGMGIIQGGGRAFDLELAITDTIASYYENKADPSMIIQSERRVPRDVFNKLRAQVRSRVAGSKRAGELLVLEAGLKADTLSTNARDALFDSLSKMSQDRIYSKFRVSRKLFGLIDSTSGDKLTDARREFDNSTLRPFMDKLQRRITDGLCAPWGVEFHIDYRYTAPPDEAVKIAAEVAAVPGIKVREVRKQYAQFGIEESTGDPKIDELVLNLPMGNFDANGNPVDPNIGAAANRPLGSQPGRPPKGENVPTFPPKAPVAKAAVKSSGKALSDIEFDARVEALETAARAEGKALEAPAPITIGNKLPKERRPADSAADARSAELDGTLDFIRAGLQDAAHELERSLLDHAEGKALPRGGKTSNVLKRVKNSAAWTAFRKRVQAVLEEASKRAASAAVMHSGLEPDEDLDYDAIAASVAHRPEGVRGIVATLKDKIASAVREARDKDEADITPAIQDAMNLWMDSQVEAIAESEAVEAYNEGTLAVAEASGIDTVYVTDGTEDQPCADADGSVWTIGEARLNRKEHPRCRRAFIPLTEAVVG